jgi:teichuronic acid biosynthesis glycosyltransferase TuaC
MHPSENLPPDSEPLSAGAGGSLASNGLPQGRSSTMPRGRPNALAEGQRPGVLVLTTVFPNTAQPNLGLFVRERMFRVARELPLVVVAPVPWFPFQGLVSQWRPGFRPMPSCREEQQGIEVLHPRFFSVPGMFKWADGFLLALSCLPVLWRLRRRFQFRVIDSHFAYPDGYAATWLGRWLSCPVTITLRGTEPTLSRYPWRRRLILKAVERADRVFSVSDSLGEFLHGLGAQKAIRRVGNGVDLDRFFPEPQAAARQRVGIPPEAKVLVTVGGLCERKGFHRVIEALPGLLRRYPGLIYLVVGGASPEGDWTERLRIQARDLGLEGNVRFLGAVDPDELRWPLSAADLFVLATRNEGWANVLLEAMACGLPVVTTDVGGNSEVVERPELGSLVPFGDPAALERALVDALRKHWDSAAIRRWAASNSWDQRVKTLVAELGSLGSGRAARGGY